MDPWVIHTHARTLTACIEYYVYAELSFAPCDGNTKNNNKRCHHVHVLKTKRSAENADRPFAFDCSTSGSSFSRSGSRSCCSCSYCGFSCWNHSWFCPFRIHGRCEPATEARHKAKLTNSVQNGAEQNCDQRPEGNGRGWMLVLVLGMGGGRRRK